jgi:hypothetical protein
MKTFNGERKFIFYSSLASLEGNYKGYTVRLSEGFDLHGRFYGEGCSIQVNRHGDNQFGFFDRNPWSSILVLDDKMFNVEFLADGPKLKLTPYTGPIAKVKLDTADPSVEVHALISNDKQSGWVHLTREGMFVPASYTLSSIWLNGGSKKPGAQLYGSGGGEKKSMISLKEGSNTVKVGPPLRISSVFHRRADSLSIAAADIVGVAGEFYRPYINTQAGDCFEWFLRNGASQKSLGKLEFG